MGKNKELRKKIAAAQIQIEEHEEKIRREQTNASPDDGLIGHWQDEITAQEKRILRLVRRLKKEW